MVKAVVLGAAGQYSPTFNMTQHDFKGPRWNRPTFSPSPQDKSPGYRGYWLLG
jgi:hypothetical protein